MANARKLPEICQSALAEAMSPALFKALSDPTRIAIVAELATRTAPATVSEISACCDIDFSGVSRHLKILNEAGIASTEKRGRETLYVLNTRDFAENLRGIAAALDICGTHATEQSS